jgi:hypothetical protein
MTAIILPERCGRATAEALLPKLVAAMGSGQIEIDGSAVSQVGLAMLQLLVSARRTGQGAAITASRALLDAAQLAGLTTELFDARQP